MSKVEEEWAEFYSKGCFELRMSLFPRGTPVEDFVKGLMHEAYLAACEKRAEMVKELRSVLYQSGIYPHRLTQALAILEGRKGGK